jgi:hypothetical protein
MRMANSAAKLWRCEARMKMHASLCAAAALCFLSAFAGAADAREAYGGFIAARIVEAAWRAPQPNRSAVSQEGTGNGAAITQTGVNNNAAIRQVGRNNTGSITQTGDNNSACLIQVGRNLDASIIQTGSNQSAGVLQTRRGAREIPPELCTMSTGRRGAALGALHYAARQMGH